MGYYWPRMKKDVVEFVKKYHGSQVQANLIHTTPEAYKVWYLVAISQLGAGLVGPFNSPSNENISILVAMEYFTKWVEAIPLRKATGEPW